MGHQPSTVKKQAIQRVTLIGAAVNLILTCLQLVVGVLAQSQALIADGFHTLSDLLSDGLVWYAAHHAAQAPDAGHPYGHARIETAATLGLSAALALVGIGIAWTAVDRLFHPETMTVPHYAALGVAAIAILSKEWLYHFTVRVGREVRSDMVLANAWHQRLDALSSVVVLAGVGGALAGLPYLDAVAASIVGVMVGGAAWELGHPAMRELVDGGLAEERLRKIRERIASVHGVRAIHGLRTRTSAGQATVEVHLLVGARLSVSEGHMVAQTVIDRLYDEVPEVSDVTVHIDPEDDEQAPPTRGLYLRDRAEAVLSERWSGLLSPEWARQVTLHYLNGRIDIDLYLSLDAFTGQDSSRRLRADLEAALVGDPCFGRVRLFYGELGRSHF